MWLLPWWSSPWKSLRNFPSWVGSVARYTTKLAEACQSLLKKRVTGILSNELAIWVSQRACEPKILSGQHSQRRMWPPASSDDWRSNMVRRSSLEPWGSVLWIFSWKTSFQDENTPEDIWKYFQEQRHMPWLCNRGSCKPHFKTVEAESLPQAKSRGRDLYIVDQSGVFTSTESPTYTTPLLKKKKAKKQPVHNLKTLYLREGSLSQAAV